MWFTRKVFGAAPFCCESHKTTFLQETRRLEQERLLQMRPKLGLTPGSTRIPVLAAGESFDESRAGLFPALKLTH
jgi:hypothetical protein